MISNSTIGKQRSVRRQLFPEKLWDLVNKPSSGIQWSPDGKRIEVERTQLEKFIGTKFRSQNFDSFIRQLHFYGFRKCGNSYHHDLFQRGQPQALLSMKRKYSGLVSQTTPPNTFSNITKSNDDTSSSTSAIDLSGCGRSMPCARIGFSGLGGTSVRNLESSMINSNLAMNNVNVASSNALAVPPSISQPEHMSIYMLKKVDDPNQHAPPTFHVKSETLARVSRDANTLHITLDSNGESAWPTALVFETNWTSNSEKLIAYLIYSINKQ